MNKAQPAHEPPDMDVAGKRVTIMGLGRHGGGVGAARFFAERGARVTVTDRADRAHLDASIERLAPYAIASWRLGGHQEQDFREADVVVVNPAVLPEDPLVAIARSSGAEITSEIEIFLGRCPAQVAAVTGSNGKSSTTAMLAACLTAAGRQVWLGGNLGGSLLNDLPRMTADDCVVLELSSFQLARLSEEARGVDLALITNCSPNHLDWHRSFDGYRSAKQRLLQLQSSTAVAVLNLEDPEVAAWQPLVRGRSLDAAPDASIPPLAIPGRHQRQNARLAAAAAHAWGASAAEIECALATFTGLPHRLEHVDTIDGRCFYNDSQATTPESTLAALAAFDAPIWLLAGGYDKGADFATLTAAIAARAAGAAFYGAIGDRLQRLTLAHDAHSCSTQVETLRQALEWCWRRSRVGDIVLLSPACASFDQYRDYAERALDFKHAVAQLKARV